MKCPQCLRVTSQPPHPSSVHPSPSPVPQCSCSLWKFPACVFQESLPENREGNLVEMLEAFLLLSFPIQLGASVTLLMSDPALTQEPPALVMQRSSGDVERFNPRDSLLPQIQVEMQELCQGRFIPVENSVCSTAQQSRGAVLVV